MSENVVFLDMPKTRVYLRPVEKGDLPFFQVMVNNERISRFLNPRSPMSMVDEENWFEDIAKSKDNRQVCSIVLKDGNKLIGNIALFKMDSRNHTAETGTAIGLEELLGKGLGTEAKMLWLKYAFFNLNLRQVYSSVFAFNGRSQSYSKKCGYKEIGRIPNHFYVDGKYHDVILLMVTREDWEPLWEKFKKEMEGGTDV